METSMPTPYVSSSPTAAGRFVATLTAALCAALIAAVPDARAQQAGPNGPGAVFNDVTFGTVAWTTPANAQTSDDMYAQVAPGSGFSNYLEATNFNMLVPAAAIIEGIEVKIERRSGVGSIVDARVRIVKGGVVGTADRSDPNPWPTVDTVVTYGGPSDLWGDTWTPTDVNATGFGVALSVTDTVDVAAVDAFTIIVHYTLCSATPRVGCRATGKTSFLVIDKADDTKDKLVWKMSKGSPTTQAELANPTSDTAYALCLYENGAFSTAAFVPPSPTLWTAISTQGFKYKDKTGAADGIQIVVLKGSVETKTKLLFKGKGAALPDPAPPLTLPVAVQIVNSDSGLCWEGVYDTPDLKKNVLGQFKARKVVP
jgi:hypothetical protein